VLSSASWRAGLVEVTPHEEDQMPRRQLLLIGIIIIVTGSAFAQEVGRVETNLDYGYLRLKVPNSVAPVNMNGLQFGVTANVNRWLGLGADFGGYYHCVAGCTGYGDVAHNDAFLFLAGPRVRLRPGREWQPFVQGSAGLLNVGYDDEFDVAPSPTGVGVVNASKRQHTGLAYAAGGGVDWMRGRAIIRVGQIDVVHYDLGGRSANTVRFTAGIRFQFGMPKRQP
jgi:hypothetical protein